MFNFDKLPEGHKIHVDYYRNVQFSDGRIFLVPLNEIRAANNQRFIHPKGGLSIATITDADGNVVAKGAAQCSTKDNFNRALGWNKAVGRAIGNYLKVTQKVAA
jgi:hypothetical protein